MPHLVLTIVILCLVGCSSIDVTEHAYNLGEFESDVLSYDRAKPNDLRNVAGTLRIYEIDPLERRDFISNSSQLFDGGKSLAIEGDGAQTSIYINRLPQVQGDPMRIRVVLGAPADEVMTIYVLERSEGGWTRISRKLLN